MAHVIETIAYKFDELSNNAKEHAREWWRNAADGDNFYAECIIDDVVQCGQLIGIEFDTRTVKLMGGGTRQDPCVWWSGFYSQGDGACFDGRYSYVKQAGKRIREYAPQDVTLHAIADRLQDIQRRHFYRLEAHTRQRGSYSHSYSMDIDVTSSETGNDVSADISESIASELRDFADWIFDQLRAQYEWAMSDEQVDENIRCNEYNFDENGKPI